MKPSKIFQRQAVIILGPPGAGKGTQAELLSEKLNLYLLETSKILENKFKEIAKISFKKRKTNLRIEGKKIDILKEKEKWEKGELCSPLFVTSLIIREVTNLFKSGKNIVFSGSPRTLFEAKRIFPLLKKLYGEKNIKVILLEIKPEETIFRNTHRKICELMRHSILYNKETEKLTLCPLDGSKLVKREIDDPKIIKVRLEEYKNKTLPIIKYLQKNNIKVEKINGERSVAEVFESILKTLRSYDNDKK